MFPAHDQATRLSQFPVPDQGQAALSFLTLLVLGWQGAKPPLAHCLSMFIFKRQEKKKPSENTAEWEGFHTPHAHRMAKGCPYSAANWSERQEETQTFV